MAMLSLDVILPTYNRADLLPKTLESLMNATRPAGLEITVYLVDNNSKDNTAELVRDYQTRFPVSLRYVFETQQGLSAALNAGIRAGTGDILAMINDDEEVDARWFEVIEEFGNSAYDFAGGPYQPNWEVPKPDWISKEYGGIVGWVDAGDTRQEYGPEFNGILMGGNVVIRRRVLDQVGLYDVTLGRTDKGLAGFEDEHMYRRLLAAGFRGIYLPELIIYHFIPAKRMTRKYHRQWCWGLGNSMAVLNRLQKPEGPLLFGMPRWQYRQAAAGLVKALKGLVGMESSHAAFQGELRVWTLVGFFNAKLFRRS